MSSGEIVPTPQSPLEKARRNGRRDTGSCGDALEGIHGTNRNVFSFGSVEGLTPALFKQEKELQREKVPKKSLLSGGK